MNGMKALVVFDSNYGNTALIAQEIGAVLEAEVVKIDRVTPSQMKGLDVLIIGSPINGWRPTGATHDFLTSLKPNGLKGVWAAAFDTRVKLIIAGNAAKPMAQELVEAGATLIADPMWFYVTGVEGPLRDGELDRAIDWASHIKNMALVASMSAAA